VDLVAVGEVLESDGLEECHGVGEGCDQAGGTTLGDVLIQCDEGRCCRTGTGTGTGRSVSSTALWC
jgi:hypothetical protein